MRVYWSRNQSTRRCAPIAPLINDSESVDCALKLRRQLCACTQRSFRHAALEDALHAATELKRIRLNKWFISVCSRHCFQRNAAGRSGNQRRILRFFYEILTFMSQETFVTLPENFIAFYVDEVVLTTLNCLKCCGSCSNRPNSFQFQTYNVHRSISISCAAVSVQIK